jgi:hypothetical protein
VNCACRAAWFFVVVLAAVLGHAVELKEGLVLLPAEIGVVRVAAAADVQLHLRRLDAVLGDDDAAEGLQG